LRDQVVEIMVGLKDYVSSAATIAAAWAAFRPILLALKRYGAFASMTGPAVDFDFINEHE
jgi:hypothetical protein